MNTKKSRQKTILIVEDENSLQTALVEKFEREKFKLFKAGNGVQGLKLALKNKPDLILLDILMPKMDGMEMLKKLRKDKWGKDVFVIILTNRDPDSDLLAEAKRSPYVSTYLMKSDYSIADIIKLVKTKLSS